MRYYIADLHFFHGALNDKMDRRGFASVEEMNEYMIEKWNKKVRKNDDVVIIGDLSWGNVQETNALLQRLKGKLYLVCGNHDRFVNNKEMNPDRFKWIKHYAELSDNRRKVVLCHYPIMCYNGQYRVDEKGEPAEYFTEAPKLCDYIQIMLQEKLGYTSFEPADIKDIVSARLDIRSLSAGNEFYSQTITDKEALKLLEGWFSNAEYIYGGADCGNQCACLELALADGSAVCLSLAVDSCSNFGVNGVYYDYRPVSDWDNREFFELFDEILWE